MSLEEVAGGWRYVTRPEHDGLLRRFFEITERSRLSLAALETLAIVAYRQPITAPEISDLRGVNSSGVLKTLFDKKADHDRREEARRGHAVLLPDDARIPHSVRAQRPRRPAAAGRARQRFRGRARGLRAGRRRAGRTSPAAEVAPESVGRPIRMSEERLQKILSAAGLCSRREAEEWIEEGRVARQRREGVARQKADLARDAIRVDGKLLRPKDTPHRYVLLNKPKGYITTTDDPEGRPTVLSLIPPGPSERIEAGRPARPRFRRTADPDRRRRFRAGGRAPLERLAKNYRVKVWGEPSEKDLERLRRGNLDRRQANETVRDREPPHDDGQEAAGGKHLADGRSSRGAEPPDPEDVRPDRAPVSKLRRVAIGPIRDEKLRAGAFRALTREEIRKLVRNEKGPARNG